MSYPHSTFITGFASKTVRTGDNVEQIKNRLILDAQKKLSESIRVQVKSTTDVRDKSIEANGNTYLESYTDDAVQTYSNAEIVGVKTETYFDQRANAVYAFAYANKFEVAGYYKANIAMLIGQAEGSLYTAKNLESTQEKSKARKQCEDAVNLLAKVRYAQDLLTALDAADSESLQQAKTEQLHSDAAQMTARLAQGVYVYLESSEDLFGKKVSIIASKVKAILAKNGCSFTDDAAQADLKITLVSTTREISNDNGLVFCYADTELDLYDNHKSKSVYNDEISQKGGSATAERAGRKAMEDAVQVIADKILQFTIGN
jgi:hypothetical protein